MMYRFLNMRSNEEYIEHFLSTLMETNKTYSYFVNWDKVIKNVNKYKHELYLLNSLRTENKNTIKDAFISLIHKYPEVIKAIPILIAERLVSKSKKIEVNFYNTSGSKPDAIVGNYITLNREAKKRGLKFIWITDGPGWREMKNYLSKAVEEIEWILNFKIAKDTLPNLLTTLF